jgi:uracil-DNA glycosylase
MHLIDYLQKPWRRALAGEFEQTYMRRLEQYLAKRRREGAVVYPPPDDIFNALNRTPPSAVKAVVLGQDPYHGPGQAHGLAFSVPPGQPPPPSLANIFKELQRDMQVPLPAHGCLARWADEGVLLLNTVLTVEQGQAGAHRRIGWEEFTGRVIEQINRLCEPSVFLLWGGDARKKAARVDTERHRVLEAPHPSPLSAYRGFLGCGHFSRCNRYLRELGRDPIDWRL